MADPKKISELEFVSALTGTELIPIVQNGVNKIMSPNLLFDDREPRIHYATGTIPVIDAGLSATISINLGVLLRKDKVLISFNSEGFPELNLKQGQINDPNTSGTPLVNSVSIGAVNPLTLPRWFVPANYSLLKCCLLVNEDSLKTFRFSSPGYYERYESALSYPSIYKIGANMEDLEVGVLIGYCSQTNRGFLNIVKLIQLTSAYLTQSGANTLLNLELKNVDTTANVALNFVVGAYEF